MKICDSQRRAMRLSLRSVASATRSSSARNAPVRPSAIAETRVASIRDVGKAMAALKAKYTGQMDFGAVGALVKGRLG